MNINEYAKQKAIITIQTGSHLYGTSTEESDNDYMGVFIPPKDYILGLKNVEQVNCGFADKDESGKNTKDAIDYTIYDIRKYINLALGNNPNILELLFVNQKNIISITPEGSLLLKFRDKFLSKNAYDKFMGYAVAQRKKMLVKKDNIFALQRFKHFLNNLDEKFDRLLLEDVMDITLAKEFKEAYKVTPKGIAIGDIFVPQNTLIKRARKIVNDRCDKIDNREELYLKYGYDVKFCMNYLRLLIQGIELVSKGIITYPLKNAEFLLDVRNGKYSLKEVLAIGEEYENILRSFKENNVLPEKANYKEIEKLQMTLLQASLMEV